MRGKQSSLKYQSTHLHPGHYILNWQKSASKQAVGNMFHLTNLWKHLQNFVTTTKFTITKAWQKHVEKRYPCIVNGTELFSDILRIKICHVNKTVVANFIISWTFVKKPYCPTQGINLRLLRCKQGANLLRFINFWISCAMIIHNLLI